MITGLKTYDLQLRALIFCCLFIACLASPAYAHKVSIYAYAERGMVYSESYFGDGSKCKNSLVEVFDEKSRTKLLEGKTDEEGRFSFKIPKTASLKLVLNAGMGHRAEYTLSMDEVRDALGVKGKKAEDNARESIQSPDLQSSDIEAVVERVVDKKLQPVMRMLTEIENRLDRPGLTEVIGGIGYIMGIMGILAYLKSKRQKKG